MHPVLKIFGHSFKTYYVCAFAAGIVGIFLSGYALKKEKAGIFCVLLPILTAAAAVAGARLLNFITNPDAYGAVFSLWTFSYKKLSLMGGLFAGIFVIMLYCIFKKRSLPRIADLFAAPAAVGVIILKTGCFLNGCCFGKPAKGPFGTVFPANAPGYELINKLPFVKALSPRVHPTQLYELFGALISILAAVIISKKLRLKDGSRAALFAALFSAARLIILPFRALPYTEAVKNYFYPLLYAFFIVFSAVFLIAANKKKRAG